MSILDTPGGKASSRVCACMVLPFWKHSANSRACARVVCWRRNFAPRDFSPDKLEAAEIKPHSRPPGHRERYRDAGSAVILSAPPRKRRLKPLGLLTGIIYRADHRRPLRGHARPSKINFKIFLHAVPWMICRFCQENDYIRGIAYNCVRHKRRGVIWTEKRQCGKRGSS